MYSQSLLITAIGYEAAKRESIARGTLICNRTVSTILGMAEKWDALHPENPECSGDILCLREGKRHRIGCPGKTVPIAQYVRGLK